MNPKNRNTQHLPTRRLRALRFRGLADRARGVALGATVASLCLGAAACDRNLLVDDPNENPGILGPRGIIRGTVTYLGAGPCLKNGQVEGVAVLLVFAFDNPPPPDGLASTALNFATVPGEKLFFNYPRPATGPGSADPKFKDQSLCPAPSSPLVSASAEFSIQQMGTALVAPNGDAYVVGGRYQVRGFYSRQNRFNALFNFANLALPGDVGGGAIADIRAASPKFAPIEVGVPYTGADIPGIVKKGDLLIAGPGLPDTGFVRESVPVTLGVTLPSNRPFFHIDYAKSKSFEYRDPAKDFVADYAAGAGTFATPKPATDTGGTIVFRQDHAITSQSDLLCFGTKDPACDAFRFSQASFPQIRFNYGFPGNLAENKLSDAWLAKNAKPAAPITEGKTTRPYYGIDPGEFGADFPASTKFMLTRQFNAAGKPDILRDNDTLEFVAMFASLFPSVVLSKMFEDENGEIALPPRSQTDPAVVIQTITLRDQPGTKVGSMKATSESSAVGGGLTDADGKAPDPNHPLAKSTGFELQEGFTALVRPSTVCIHTKKDLRGTLVTPVRYDPNPANDFPIVIKEKVLANNPNRVKDVQFGCLPPGHYAVNVVYPTGQAWSFPNLMGFCSHTARFQPNEDCLGDVVNGKQMHPFVRPDAAAPIPFSLRPLLASQSHWAVDPGTGLFKTFEDPPAGPMSRGRKALRLPQTVVIMPTARCGSFKKEDTACTTDDACTLFGKKGVKGSCAVYAGADATKAGRSFCDLNGDGRVSPNVPVWVSNDVNEDTSVPDTDKTYSTGVFSDAKDLNKNGVLDLATPAVCSLSSDNYDNWLAKK